MKKKYDLDKLTKKIKEIKKEKEIEIEEEAAIDEFIEGVWEGEAEEEKGEDEHEEELPEVIEKVKPQEASLSNDVINEFKIINLQLSLFQKTLETLEYQKKLLLHDKENILENLNDVKKDVEKKYCLNFDDYSLDIANKKLIKKP